MAGPSEFASLYGDAAARAGAALGVDPSVILGQWGLETGWGRSIVPGTNNLGNIKDFAGGGVAATDNMTGSRDKYRAYRSPDDFAADYVSLVARKYPGAVGAGADPMRFATGLQGYAEDPRYADKIAQASRMVSSAPGPVMSALGRVVGSLIPSANAQQRKAPMANNDAASPEWEELNSRFSPQAAQPAQAAGDPWAELNAQFAQPAAQKASPRSQPREEAPAREGSVIGDIGRVLANATPFGMLTNAVARSGAERDSLKGVASGFADLGNTIINRGTKSGADLISAMPDSPLTSGLAGRRAPNGLSNVVTGQAPQSPSEISNAERNAGLAQFNQENNSLPFAVGRLAGNLAATAPVGGVVGAGVKGAAALPALSRAAPILDAAGNAIASGGLRTGMAPASMLGQVGNMGLRMAGGGASGYMSAGLIDPESANVGGAIGAALPPVVAGFGKAGGMVAQGVRAIMTPEEVKAARAFLAAGGYKTPEEIAAVRAALAQQGPNIVPEGPTAPQLLQNPGISQLQRTLRNSGETALLEREAAQNASRLAVLDRVSPVSGTVQQSAENFGNGLAASVLPAEAKASQQVRAAFDAVDPFNETRIHIPIEEMQAAKDKFLGPGTFGTGGKVDAALAEARRIGTETLPAITTAKDAKGGMDLVEAVRRAGGINGSATSGKALAGELRDLRQSGLRSLVKSGGGQSLDTLAERLHLAGYIDDADPVTLLNALRSGERVMPNTANTGDMFRGSIESAMGDAPGATVIPKAVAFREIQNMRSSLGEAAEQASAKGANREAAALRQMVDALDQQTNAAAAGKTGDFFPADIVDSWRKAIKLHADKMETFHTGPQAQMFRKAGDGLPQAQGAELAPKFFNPRGSQSSDIASFRKIGTPETEAALKNYAITDLANQTDRLGTLSNAKFQKWLDSRSGATKGLFTDSELAQLAGVRKDLERADAAMALGKATGSNTAQNVQSALGLGLLDSPVVNGLANRIPVVGRFTGPMLEALKETAKRGKVERLSGLLADPAALDAAIADSLSRSVRGPGMLEREGLIPLLLRSAPTGAAGSGRQ